MVLTAYLDDSGTHKESPYVAIAGAIGREAAWAALTLKWDELLTAAEIDVFHCTDCMAQQGEFAGWTPDRSAKFVNKLIDVFLGTEGLYGIGACLCRRDYEALVAPEKRRQVGYPTLLCLRHAIHRVDEFQQVDKSAQIGVIFETADDYAARGPALSPSQAWHGRGERISGRWRVMASADGAGW